MNLYVTWAEQPALTLLLWDDETIARVFGQNVEDDDE